MTITFRQYTGSTRDGARPFVDFNRDPSCAETSLFRVDASKPQPINAEVNAGIPLADTFRFLYGPARTTQTGKDVVINVEASHTVGITVEESSNGTTWPDVSLGVYDDIEAFGGQSIGIRCKPSAPYYRLRVSAGAGMSVSKVFAASQVRDAGV